jgi:hypothetical protein
VKNHVAAEQWNRRIKIVYEQQIVLLKKQKYENLARWLVPGPGGENSIKVTTEGDRILRKYKLGPYAGND